MQDINAWLQSDQDYNTGLALYAKYGKSDFLKKLFADGPTPFNNQKLEAELQKLAPTLPATEQSSIEPEDIHSKPGNISALTVTDPNLSRDSIAENQVRYLAIKDDIGLRYRQMENNMLALDYVNDEDILCQTAKQVLKLHRKIRDNWMLIDHFDEHGYFPYEKVKKPSITSAMQLLHVGICKAKKRLLSPNCRNIAETQKLLEEKQLALKTLQGEMKGKPNNE